MHQHQAALEQPAAGGESTPLLVSWAAATDQITRGLASAIPRGDTAVPVQFSAPAYLGGPAVAWIIASGQNPVAGTPSAEPLATRVSGSRMDAPARYPVLALFANIAARQTGLVPVVARLGPARFAELAAALTQGPVLASRLGIAATVCLLTGSDGAELYHIELATNLRGKPGQVQLSDAEMASLASDYIILADPGTGVRQQTADDYFASYWAG